MGIDCVNINQTQEPNLNEFVDELLPVNGNNFVNSFKFSINGRNYLFYIKKEYDLQTGEGLVTAKLVDETSCYDSICSTVASLDLNYVTDEIYNSILPNLCNAQGNEQVYSIYDVDPIELYDLQQVSSNEYLAVVKIEEALFEPKNGYDLYILLFDVYLIFRISSSSMTLERVEIPILKYISSGGCLPDYAPDEQGFLRYEGNNLFLYAGISSDFNDYYNATLLIYSLNIPSYQTNILAQQQIYFSTNPQDYGITSPPEYTFELYNYKIHPVYNSNDLFVLETNLSFRFYDTSSGFGVRFEPIFLKVIQLSPQNTLTISNFYTPAFYSNFDATLINLLNVSNSYVSHADFIAVKFFKIDNKIVLAGYIDYITIEDLADINKINVAMLHQTSDRIPATFVVYDFDRANLKLILNQVHFTGSSVDNNSDFGYSFFNSVLPIFEEKTTNPTTPYGVFLNASAKPYICQIIASKYSIYDCSQIEFYFVEQYVPNFYDHPLNAGQSFSDGCGLSMIAALRLLSSQSAFESSFNEAPIDEYLAIVLFRFSFDKQGNLIKEYRILDVIKLYVVSPADTYVGRQESVYIPQIFFDNQKRLHYSVYVYSELPQAGGGGVAM